MKKLLIVFIGLCFWLVYSNAQSSSTQSVRQRMLFDTGWRFAYGHPFDKKKDFNNGTGYFSYLAKTGYGDGPAAANFDDRAWRKVDLPHDWVVELPFDPKGTASHGFKAVGRYFPENNIGWYRKSFTIANTDLGKKISLEFDGIYRNSIVWVNGHYLGTEPSGYNSISYDITDYLNYGGNNTVAVRADAGMEEGWFYEGAGIYRHVWMVATNPVHVVRNGTFVTSALSVNDTTVTARSTIVNDGFTDKTVEVIQSVVDANGRTVASGKAMQVTLKPHLPQEVTHRVAVPAAMLWSIENPFLYRLVTTVVDNGKPVDEYRTKFGIRTIRFDANEGFFLNGKPVKLKGTNNHQDHAGVGVAMPDGLQYYRIKTLKAFGCNAYRCSHNPPTPELLDACDSLGMLVIDENRLMGITDEILGNVKSMVMRDRNHPSIISWSVGNEEWAIEGNITGARIAATMQSFVKSIDTTRGITAAVSGGRNNGISTTIDVMGFNYLGLGTTEEQHKNFPRQPAMGTEEGSTQATRGIFITDDKKQYKSTYDKRPNATFYSLEEGWKYYAERKFLAGMFIWTGFDYRGEPTPYGWPSINSYFGMLDVCGFPKDNFYYLKSWWTNQPVIHILPHWNWKGMEGQELDVWVHSNSDEVELFVNKKSLGRKVMEKNGHLAWKVKYAAGVVEAVGYKNKKKWISEQVKTTGEATALSLKADTIAIAADRQQVAVVTVNMLDANQKSVPTAGNNVTFSISGPGKIIGVGNGDPTCLEPDQFIESITTPAVQLLKQKVVSGISDTAGTAVDVDDTEWANAFSNNKMFDSAKAILYRGTIDCPAAMDSATITWFYNTIGQMQSVYLNGKPMGTKLNDNQKGYAFEIDKSLLKPGKNTIAIVATPFVKKNSWDTFNTDAGVFAFAKKASFWQRSLFNGLAQVIIQSTGKPGEIILKASANGVASATLTVKANAN